uniref:4-hydroxythreonine-4-phosphate dehydrogenase PdxA n=1 Tax=Maricaulis sp. TaxID=1486257 RepID=UPI002630BC81
MTQPPPVGVTMGDPAGIGPEIILRAWASARTDLPPFFAIGSADVFTRRARDLGLALPFIAEAPPTADEVFPHRLTVLPASQDLVRPAIAGQADSAHAPAVKAAIEDGVSLCLNGQARALVTAPIAKSVMYEAGFNFPGHTEFLAALTKATPLEGPRGPAMMLAGGGLRVVLTSIHVPLKQAIQDLSAERVEMIARLTHAALKRDFGIAAPRLALAGLNPHAGEGGTLGDEEEQVLNPLTEKLRTEGLMISGPLPPDTMFHAEARAGYDAAICLYHDQGLIPVKTLDFHGGVNITLGLPIVRTS